MRKKIYIAIIVFINCISTEAQIDPLLLKRPVKDTSKQALNMDAMYNRPFITAGKLPVSVGGYMEANWQHLATNGISAGHEFQFRRLSLFVTSSITKRIKFMTEIEFENEVGEADEAIKGPETEVGIEFAAIDVEFHPLLNLRGGIIVNPIGAFNQNHDGPKWEFTDRPIAMTQMLPGTWSNSGFGLYGKQYKGNWMFGYEFYLTGGFDNSIINNSENKTFLPAAKENSSRLVTIASGKPLLTAKGAVRNSKIGELGISYMGGIYNKFTADGLTLDDKRKLSVVDIDFNTTIQKFNTLIIGEWTWIHVDVPATYSQQYGRKQQGGYVDIIQPILRRKMLGWEKATLNLACRLEYVDWNVGKFKETGGNIADDLWSIMPAISFRPTAQTVFRFNYRYQQQKDILGNPPSKTGGFIFGISTYF